MKLKCARKFDERLDHLGICSVAGALIGSALIGVAGSAISNSGSRTTTVTNVPAPMSAAEQEAERLRLAELRRQNDLAEQLLPGQKSQIELQNKLIEYQLAHMGDMDTLRNSQLQLAQLQIQQQISDAAMQERLRPQQLEYLTTQNKLAQQQLEALGETTSFTREQNKYILAQLQDQAARIAARNKYYSPEEEAQAAAEEARRAARMGTISEEAAQIQLENLKRGNKPTADELQNINTAIDASQASGESNIRKFLTGSLRQINEEVSQASGLRPTDTPPLRLSERAGEEASRQQGELTSNLEQARATAKLNYPLAVSQVQDAGASHLQSLTQSAAQFQDQLRLAAQANRSQAFASPPMVGFSMPQSGPSPNLGFMNPGAVGYNPGAFNMNFYRGGGTQTTVGPGFGLQQAGQLAGGIGSFMSGYGRLYGSGA